MNDSSAHITLKTFFVIVYQNILTCNYISKTTYLLGYHQNNGSHRDTFHKIKSYLICFPTLNIKMFNRTKKIHSETNKKNIQERHKVGVCHLLDEMRRGWQGLNIQDVFSLTINYLFTIWNGTIIWQYLFTTCFHMNMHTIYKNTYSSRAARLISHGSYILSWKRLLNSVQTRCDVIRWQKQLYYANECLCTH